MPLFNFGHNQLLLPAFKRALVLINGYIFFEVSSQRDYFYKVTANIECLEELNKKLILSSEEYKILSLFILTLKYINLLNPSSHKHIDLTREIILFILIENHLHILFRNFNDISIDLSFLLDREKFYFLLQKSIESLYKSRGYYPIIFEKLLSTILEGISSDNYQHYLVARKDDILGNFTERCATAMLDDLSNIVFKCCICLTYGCAFSSQSKSLSCGHLFHDTCINSPLVLACPLCRVPIPQHLTRSISEHIERVREQQHASPRRLALMIFSGCFYGWSGIGAGYAHSHLPSLF